MVRTARLFVAALLAALTSASAASAATCPDEPAPALVQSQSFYSDAKGSVVDAEKLRQNLALIAPIRRFVTEASQRADSADRSEQDCALNMMLAWARGHALLDQPRDFAAMRERERWAIALDIIALKLRADGKDITPLVDWLAEMDHGVLHDFGRRSRSDNLNAWSGVAAASLAVLKEDREAKAYADAVWRQSIAAIRPDGYVDTELARGPRALLYHAYYLSALMTLKAFRHAAGVQTSAGDHAAIERLAGRVAAGLCDSTAMAGMADGGAQEKVAITEFIPINAFAADLGGPSPLKCAPPDIPATDPVMGGDMTRTAQILARGRR